MGVGNHLTPGPPGLRLVTPTKRAKATSHLPLGQTRPYGVRGGNFVSCSVSYSLMAEGLE